ncbi:hypothetical protein [Terriglobus roseus]|uniref:Uncharacterized protein n=1 Tax=Terriglobus roseus TaxID=392734 RepID=A0A1G7JKE6_9BACT|nr:hypothetical protein [Terriglobus roseus]SDF25400.1 hypothetical protein SAMN05444167_1854 [Terriglobus roseus]
MIEPALFVFAVMFVLPLALAAKVLFNMHDPNEDPVQEKVARQTLTGMPLREKLQRMGIPALAD